MKAMLFGSAAAAIALAACAGNVVGGGAGAPFVTRRYPQMCVRLERVRRKLAVIVARPPGTS